MMVSLIVHVCGFTKKVIGTPLITTGQMMTCRDTHVAGSTILAAYSASPSLPTCARVNPTNCAGWQAFPSKLYEILEGENPDIIGWTATGRGFEVRLVRVFFLRLSIACAEEWPVVPSRHASRGTRPFVAAHAPSFLSPLFLLENDARAAC